MRVFSLRVLALVSPSFHVSFFNQECLLFECCGPWARGNVIYISLPIGSMLVPLPGGRSAAVNWSRGTVRRATLGSSRCCKYRARWEGGLGFAEASAPLAFVSVRIRLSSCLIRWLSNASSTLRSFGCSPPSIGGGGGLHWGSGSGSGEAQTKYPPNTS